jgi:hypothetical protein
MFTTLTCVPDLCATEVRLLLSSGLEVLCMESQVLIDKACHEKVTAQQQQQ